MRLQYLSFVAAVGYLLPLLGATPINPPEHNILHARVNPNAGSSKSAAKKAAPQAEGRQAYVLFTIKKEFEDTWRDPHAWPAHSALWIDGNTENGAVKIELASATSNYKQPKIRFVEFAKGQRQAPEPEGNFQRRYSIGITHISNKDLLDSQKEGAGFVMDAVNDDPQYRTGNAFGANLNTCHDFLRRVVGRLAGLRITPNTIHLMTWYHAWARGTDGSWNRDASIQRVTKCAPEKSEGTIIPMKSFKTAACRDRKTKRDPACSALEYNVVATKPGSLEGNSCDEDSALAVAELLIEIAEIFSGATPLSDVLDNSKDASEHVSSLRKSYLKPASPAVSAALGWTCAAIGTAFWIIDLFNRQWKSAAVCGIGLAAGITASLAMSGPTEWIVGGLLTTLFAKKSPAFRMCLTRIVNATALKNCRGLHLGVMFQSVLTSLPHGVCLGFISDPKAPPIRNDIE